LELKKGRKMRNFIFVLILTIGILHSLYEDIATGVRPLALSGAFTALAEGPEAVHFNPAGLDAVRNFSLSGYYKSLYGGISGLHNIGFTVVKSIYNNSLALTAQEIGANLEGEDGGKYSESSLTLSFARSIHPQVSIGFNLNLFRVQHPRFGSTNSFGFDMGLLSRFHRKWRMGFFIENFVKPVFRGKERDYELPRILYFGFALEPTDRARSSITLRKEPDYPTRISFGQEVDLISNLLTLRGGIMNEASLIKFSFGMSLLVKGLDIGYALIVDPNLPLTHTFGISSGR
jgi:hypothetical protein